MRPYAKNLLSMMANIAVTHRVVHPLLTSVDHPQRVLLVVINSDRGLCGGFNANVSRFAEEYYREHESQLKQLDIMVIGRESSGLFGAKKH